MKFPNLNVRNSRPGFLTGPGGGSGRPAKPVNDSLKVEFGNLLSLKPGGFKTKTAKAINPGLTASFEPGEGQAKNSVAASDRPRKTPSAPANLAGQLQARLSIKNGQDTGRVFSPASLRAWRKENGYYRRYAEGEGPDPAQVEKNIAGENIPAASGRFQPAEAADRNFSAKMPSKINQLIDKAAQALGLDPDLVRAVVKVESNFNSQAVSPAGAMGLMQLMPGTAKELGVDQPFEPYANLLGGVRYLKQMLERYNQDLDKALAAYNWGPGNLDRYGREGRLPSETRNYIKAVNRHYQNFAGWNSQADGEPLAAARAEPAAIVIDPAWLGGGR